MLLRRKCPKNYDFNFFPMERSTARSVNMLLPPIMTGMILFALIFFLILLCMIRLMMIECSHEIEMYYYLGFYCSTHIVGIWAVEGFCKRFQPVFWKKAQAGKGLSNKEIAMELNITEATVKKHITKVLEKLGVEKREQIMDKSFIDKTTGKRYNQFTRSNQ